MTVSYQYEVASSTSGGFTRLLFMWRGSLYKLIYRELLLFLCIFGVISALYRHVFSIEQKKSFEKIVVYCDTFINLIPLSFVLGFYVAYVAGRWWQQYTAIPWPDKVMHSVALYVIGNDDYGRMVRRALMRYLNLSLILVLRSISSAVKRRFPTLDHVVDSGFMTSLELELFVSVPSLEFNTYWIPCTWFINLLKEARTNHRLPDSQGLKIIMEEFNDFRAKCGMLWSYDWVSIPLVYTQVVTLATYSFFAVALVGRQYIEGFAKPFQMQADIYFPIFTVLQFFFFMGLLKVAEQLINPFGDDDEDFELNWLIDRHTKVSYLGVDTLMNRCPPLVKDIYYDSENLILPYTEAAASYKRKTYRGSVANMTVPEEKQGMFLPNITEEEENVPSTPRNSSVNLAHHNDSPSASIERQGGSSPQPSRKLARNSSETIVTLDIREECDQQRPVDQPEKSNGRPPSGLVDVVKMFSSKAKSITDQQGRKPFFALAKSSKVNIQPWPSATNLKSAPVLRLDWNREGSETCLDTKRLHQTRSYNIPSIDVRQSSIDTGYRYNDDDNNDDDLDDDIESEIMESTSRRRSQAIFDARAGSVNRGFLCRESSIEEESRLEPISRSTCALASTDCQQNDSTDRISRQRFGSRGSTGSAGGRGPAISSRRRSRTATGGAARFHSFPKFLAKRQRSLLMTTTTTAAGSAGHQQHHPTLRSTASAHHRSSEGRNDEEDDDDDVETLAVSKSSPDLSLAVDIGVTASGGAASGERVVRATFFTGNDEEDEEEEDVELREITVKRS